MRHRPKSSSARMIQPITVQIGGPKSNSVGRIRSATDDARTKTVWSAERSFLRRTEACRADVTDRTATTLESRGTSQLPKSFSLQRNFPLPDLIGLLP
jgi:hypothetical protein